MKNTSASAIVLISIFFLLTTFNYKGSAQNTWKGGTIGKPTQWNVASNWSKNQVPDWSETVIIPDVQSQSGYFPEIDEKVATIPHLEIHSEARLLILPSGQLRIDGHTTQNSGILLQGVLIVEGTLEIVNTFAEEIDIIDGKLIWPKLQDFAKN